MEKFQPLLDYINRIVDLTEEEERLLTSFISTRKLLKGQYFLQQGDVCKFSGFVISGCTKTFYVDDEGQEHVVMFSIEDWWTSDMGSYITQKPADFNVQCLENTELIQFSYENQQQMMKEIPKLERFFRIIVQRALVASQKRIVRNLSMSAKDRFLFFRKEYPKIEQRIPQYLIASYLGITKEFLSKIKSQLILEQ
ncbi:Crp/Fnr family transcriptional regulator [Lutimonas zeaxanthinifaciens]|uniref:Crp/Fnr family transcriptional regulator n=1 Tax=Lutimonas zeaxanthinifaciens TaxID=3060215 RepID=UPI00265D4A8E|nr:Crp/Fnr family transcriptional regulator [Lutimonas sp. YSD2104]WKK66436.1 Crp/Fnr family transcriptional regulator [Lutimonas sp. YSD2104]